MKTHENEKIDQKMAKSSQNTAEIVEIAKKTIADSEIDLALNLLLRFLSPVHKRSGSEVVPAKETPTLSIKRKHFEALVDPLYKLVILG